MSTTNAGRPGGVEEDELRGFHRAIAVQSYERKTAEFREVVRNTEAVRREFIKLVGGLDSQACPQRMQKAGIPVRLRYAKSSMLRERRR